MRERRPIRQKVNYRCYFLIIILIQKKSPLNSNHVHVFYIHGIVIGLNLVYPWNKTAVSTIFHITIQGKSNPKRMRQKCAVQNCESYAGKCQYRLFRFPTPCPLSWLAVVGRGIWHPKKSSRICSKHFRKSDITPTGRLLKSAVPINHRDHDSMSTDINSNNSRANINGSNGGKQ